MVASVDVARVVFMANVLSITATRIFSLQADAWWSANLVVGPFLQFSVRMLQFRTGGLLLELDGNGGSYCRPVQRAREAKMGGVKMPRDDNWRDREVGRTKFRLRKPTPNSAATTALGIRITTQEVIRRERRRSGSSSGGLAGKTTVDGISTATHTLS